MEKPSLSRRLAHELRAYSIVVVYLALFFGVFTSFERLTLAGHGIRMEEYGVAIVKALVLGKVVLVADRLGLGRRFQDRPLSIPTLWATIVFTACALAFHVAEIAARHLLHAGLRGLGDAIARSFDRTLLAEGLVVFFSFVPFFAVRELTRVLGERTLSSLFFRRPQPRAS